jgi:hypothetical protein
MLEGKIYVCFEFGKTFKTCTVCISMKVLTVKHDVNNVEKYYHLSKLVVAIGILIE